MRANVQRSLGMILRAARRGKETDRGRRTQVGGAELTKVDPRSEV